MLLFGWQELLLLLLEEERAMVKTLHEVRIAELLPFSDLIFFVRLKFFQVIFHALNPDGDQVDRMLSDHGVDLLEVHDLVRHLIFIEMLDEGKVLLGEEARLVFASHFICFPFLGFGILLGQFGDYSSELKDLVIDRIHLIFIFKQVILVYILNLKLVVLRPARLNAVAIVQHPERVLTRRVSTCAHWRHIFFREYTVALREHLNKFLLANLEEISPRVIPLRNQGLQVHKMLRIVRIRHQV